LLSWGDFLPLAIALTTAVGLSRVATRWGVWPGFRGLSSPSRRTATHRRPNPEPLPADTGSTAAARKSCGSPPSAVS